MLDFDEVVGLGTVRADDGHDYPFHCVAVADGSRRVPVGGRVWFTVAPGLPGRWEAIAVAPLPAQAQTSVDVSPS